MCNPKKFTFINERNTKIQWSIYYFLYLFIIYCKIIDIYVIYGLSKNIKNTLQSYNETAIYLTLTTMRFKNAYNTQIKFRTKTSE